MDELQIELWERLEELSGEEVARLFTNFYGNKLLNEDFYESMKEEGYIY